MNRYHKIDDALRREIDSIEPSMDGQIAYYPCSVMLKSGAKVQFVCIAEAESYFEKWGVWPENDSSKRSILIEDIAHISESENRLPARFASQLYISGESGMGYYKFRLKFTNGLIQSYLCYSLVDFIIYPEGLFAKDIVNITRDNTYTTEDAITSPNYSWCLYSE